MTDPNQQPTDDPTDTTGLSTDALPQADPPDADDEAIEQGPSEGDGA